MGEREELNDVNTVLMYKSLKINILMCQSLVKI